MKRLVKPFERASRGFIAVLAALLLLVTAFQVVAAPIDAPDNPPSSAQAGVDGGFELISAAYNVVQDRFFRPLDSRVLLDAAWKGAIKGLTEQRRGSTSVSAPVLSGDREGDLAAFKTQYGVLIAAAGSSVDASRVAMTAARDMVDSVGEQHTVFLNPEQFGRFKASLLSDRDQGQVGLGIQIAGQTAPFVIALVIPGAPAEEAGVQTGDRIERVNGRETRRLELRDVAELLRGEVGQPVTLTVSRGEQSLDIIVTRARFILPPLMMRVLPEGVCHFRLSTFPVAYAVGPTGRTISQELDFQLEQCEAAGGQGWILDLRGNGGGSSLKQVLGRFLDHGPILVERDRAGGRYEQSTDGHLFHVQRPLVVLIDGGSASASEATASAIQEYKRGVVLGQQSAGALNTANILPLPLDAGMEVAIREVFTGIREIAVDEVGVSPDISLSREADTSTAPRQAIELALRPPSGIGPLPAPPAASPGPVLVESELRRRLEPLMLQPDDAAQAEDRVIPGELLIDTLGYYADDVPDLKSERDRALRLGWQGGLVRWLGKGFPPPFAVQAYIYTNVDGAHRDFREIYEPGEPRNAPQYRDVDVPAPLGDDARALVGTGTNEGRIWLSWRRGTIILTVSQNISPGQPTSFDSIVRLAGIVDARAAQVSP